MHRIVPILILPIAAAGAATAAPAYLRYPDIHGDKVAFTAEGDLWLWSLHGGPARRLTSHEAEESFPRFSPDGTLIAFTGGYDGNRDVYAIPAEGGEPRRLTWHPAPDEVIGFAPDGKSVIFRSRRESPHSDWSLFKVPAAGGDVDPIPLGYAARLSIDPESGRYAFNRAAREGATWKRYRGGTAARIWVGDPVRADFQQITRGEAAEGFPMWHGGRIYYLSDQGGAANLWSMLPDGADRQKLTRHTDWDVRYPSMGDGGRIAYMLAGDIWLYDATDGSGRKLDVKLESDRTLTRIRYPEPAEYLTFYDISPKGDRLLVTTRGEVYSVAVKDGVTLPVTRGSAARESWASYSPKGDRIVTITDESREEAIVTADAWGRGKVQVVHPAGASGWHFPPAWSPDGRWMAWADQTQTLWVAPAAGGLARKVDASEQAEIRQYAWSPDGRYLAYAKLLRTELSVIAVYDTTASTVHAITSGTTSSDSPAWDPEGRYLYFASDRAVNPLLDSRDLEYVHLRPTRLYMALLSRDVRNPLAPLSGLPGSVEEEEKEDKEGDKGEGGEAKGKTKDGGKKADEDQIVPVRIDFEGIEDRTVPLKVDAGSYGALSATADKLFYESFPLKGMADAPGSRNEGEPDIALFTFDLSEKKAALFVDKIQSYALAPKAGKVAVMRKKGEIYVVKASAPPGDKLGEHKVEMNQIVLELDPRAEWEQMYYEAWRHMRDFVWEEGLGGLDWKKVRDQYATLLPRLATREDLRDLLGELIGELATSHTYVWGGDPGIKAPTVSTGLLGAALSRHGDAYRVDRIYRGDPADGIRSPLREPEASVREGEYVLAVNHRSFQVDRPFEASLANLAGKPVVLSVNATPSQAGARDVVVVPLDNEDRLRYADWVRGNRAYVEQKTGGRMGYVHIPDMGTNGLSTFSTWFYPLLEKEGLVVDVRWNRGGFVSQMILERLRRKVVSFARARGGGISTYPARALNGPFVVITNELAGSDGDIFPAAVQLLGLAPVIGVRSWGGVIGIRGDKQLVDGGALTEPEYAWWDPKHGWGIENHGVDPDVQVDDLPQELARGVDSQLDKAIEVLSDLAARQPPLAPAFGPAPRKTRDAFEQREKGAE